MDLVSCYSCGVVIDLQNRELDGEEHDGCIVDCCWYDDVPCHTWKCPVCDTVNDTTKEV